jgi:NhaA family Na+:H+ antiporter
LPLLAALGGMVIPALTYLLIAGGESPRGWGVPMATDIALAVGLLTTLGDRVPRSLRAFLLGLAVVDDIAAIIVIAIFYSDGVSTTWLLYAGASLLFVAFLKSLNVQFIGAYLTAGILLWFALHEAGVHATLAGVVMGLLTPNTPKTAIAHVDEEDHQTPSGQGSVSVLEWFEHLLHPWSAFIVVPLFALANAGISLSRDSISAALDSRVAWGVFAGLVIGKPLGVFFFSMIAHQTKIARLPDNARPIQLMGIGNAAGIGFTVALFISELAFTSEQHKLDAKFAILAASTISTIAALVVLARARSQAVN